MNEPAKFNNVFSFLWAIADLLNGAFKKSEFQKIILPFTVLRRLDYASELTSTGGRAHAEGKGLGKSPRTVVPRCGSVLHDDANLALNLRRYVMGYSPKVREIFAALILDEIREIQPSNFAAFPGHLFSSTQIPVCVWFLAKK